MRECSVAWLMRSELPHPAQVENTSSSDFLGISHFEVKNVHLKFNCYAAAHLFNKPRVRSS